MKSWCRPLFSFFALLAVLLPLLPQAAWSCPMTGRIVHTAMVCATPHAVPASSLAKPHACCPKHKMAGAAAQPKAPIAKAKPAHAGCTNPGGPCCKLVRLPGKLHTTTSPSGAVFDAPLQNSGHTAHAGPVLAVMPAAQSLTLPAFVRTGDHPAEIPLSSQHCVTQLSGRAPPTS